MNSCDHEFDLLRQCHKCGLGMVHDPKEVEVPHDREALQRILYEIIASYDQAHEPIVIEGRRGPFGRQKITTLGGDSELLRDAIRIGKIMLKENDWWPDDRD